MQSSPVLSPTTPAASHHHPATYADHLAWEDRLANWWSSFAFNEAALATSLWAEARDHLEEMLHRSDPSPRDLAAMASLHARLQAATTPQAA